MPHTIELLDNTLAVMNDDGEICEAHAVTSRRVAKRKIAEWLQRYTFEYAMALRLLDAVAPETADPDDDTVE